MRQVYLDNNATTPVDPRVLEAMLPYFTEKFGNAASRNHTFGWEAEEAVETAREQVAGADRRRAAQGDHLDQRRHREQQHRHQGRRRRCTRDKGNHIITQATEHKAVIDPCKYLEQHGFAVTFLPVDKHGRVDARASSRRRSRDETILVSIMFANNEIGTIQPIAEIGAAVQGDAACSSTPTPRRRSARCRSTCEAMGIDLLSLSAHKIYGPKGVGALYVRRKNPRVRCEPVIHGGGHERGMRTGTLNVPGIVGLGEGGGDLPSARWRGGQAARRPARPAVGRASAASWTTIRLQRRIRRTRLPNTLNVSFAYVEGETLMMGFDSIAVSSGRACTSASLEPSYVLKALGVGDDLAHSSIRFSLGRFNTEEEIDQHRRAGRAARCSELREMSPLYEMAQEGIDLSKVEWQAH